MVFTAIFTAVILVMALTPLGYLKIGPVEITLIPIPVTIGAIALGPGVGAFLGAVFGVTSYVQCFMGSAFGQVILGINPFFAAVVCIIPRILCGFLTGLIFRALSKKIGDKAVFICGFMTAFFNTVLFLTLLYFLYAGDPVFKQQIGDYSFISIFVAFAGINGIVEILASALICPPCCIAVKKAMKY